MIWLGDLGFCHWVLQLNYHLTQNYKGPESILEFKKICEKVFYHNIKLDKVL